MTCPIRLSDDGPESRDPEDTCTHCGDDAALVQMGDEALCGACHRWALEGERLDLRVMAPARITHLYFPQRDTAHTPAELAA